MLEIAVPALILLLVIALLIFGPGRIGSVGRALWRAIRDCRKAMRGQDEEAPTAGKPDSKDS